MRDRAYAYWPLTGYDMETDTVYCAIWDGDIDSLVTAALEFNEDGSVASIDLG